MNATTAAAVFSGMACLLSGLSLFVLGLMERRISRLEQLHMKEG